MAHRVGGVGVLDQPGLRGDARGEVQQQRVGGLGGAVRGALLQLRRDTGLPIALGGTLAPQGRLKLTELVGTTTTASAITHDYDAAVSAS